MWHEARKQERKIRGMLVDYRKRAERRQDFYEKIKADPTQFMQIHSRKCKIHLDPAVAAACDSPAIMMPWQGQQDNMIDRFDGRAYLDIDKIPVAPKSTGKETEELTPDERQCNYERYRILAQNDFLGISEEKYLHQLHLEEQFGINAQIEIVEKSKKKTGGVAIGYTYEDSNDPTPFTKTIAQVTSASSGGTANVSAADEDSDSDLDVDVAIDISKIDTAQAHELNACGRNYGMKSNDFYSFLTKDADEADALKLAREEEQEKIMLSGRKSRRERRAQRERRFAGRPISPPSYAAKEELPYKDDDEKNESAESRSPSPENSGKITFITSFGGEDELQPHSKISINFNKQQKQSGAYGNSGAGNSHSSATITGNSVSYADKVKENLDKLKHLNNIRYTSDESPVKPLAYQRRSSYSRSRSRSKRSSRSYSRRRGRSSSRHIRRRSTSRSRSRRRYSKDRSNSSRSQYRKYQSSSRKRYTSSSSASSSSVSPVRRKRQTSTSSSSSSSSVASNKSRSTRSSKSRSLSPVRRERSRSKSLPVPDSVSTVPMEVDLPSAGELITQSAAVSSFTIVEKQFPITCEEPAAPIKKYYGRKREDQSTSEDDESNEEITEPMDTINSNDRVATTRFTGQNDSTANNATISSNTISSSQTNSKFGKLATTTSTTTTTTTTSTTITVNTKSSAGKSLSFNPRDRLKRKMQNLLNKQYKADKLAEIEKTERQVQQQQEREDEMRELALRLRRRQRELRHKYGTPTNSHSDDSDKSSSSEFKNSPKNGNLKKISKSRTRSPTPQKKRSRSRQRQTAAAKRRSSRDRSRDRSSRGDHRSANSRRRSPPPRSSHDRSSRFRSRSRSRDGGNRDYYNQRRRYSRNRHSRSISRDRRRNNSRHDRDRHGASSASSKRSPRKLVDY